MIPEQSSAENMESSKAICVSLLELGLSYMNNLTAQAFEAIKALLCYYLEPRTFSGSAVSVKRVVVLRFLV